MNEQAIKHHIRTWIKSGGKIESAFGEITIGKPIAEGGTALVYASDFAGGTAVKFLAESVSTQSTRYRRFLSEYVNLVRLVPTGVIVPLYSFGVQDMGDDVRVPYIVMERCLETLDSRYRRSKLTDVTEFRTLLERLLLSLEMIHASRIIHRDFKPKNILRRPNGDWVLSDFGISWFDPEFYDQLALTDRNERLANWGFSAPEQLRRDAYDKAMPCLDLYALGQTLYYCVSGHPISGTGYPHLTQLAPELGKYDSLIDRLVRQEPSDRFQSVSEVRHFLAEQERKSQLDRDIYRANEMLKQVREFDWRLRRSAPGSTAYYQAKSKKEIDRILASLAEDCDSYDLWWMTHHRNNPVSPMKKLSCGIWLIGCYECEIDDLWVYRNPSLERQYVAVHLAPRPPFGFIEIRGGKRDTASYFRDRYVDPNMFYDGFADIDGEIIELSGAEERRRNLTDDFLVLAPQLSVYNYHPNDHSISDVYRSIISAGKISASLLAPFEKLLRADWMAFMD